MSHGSNDDGSLIAGAVEHFLFLPPFPSTQQSALRYCHSVGSAIIITYTDNIPLLLSMCAYTPYITIVMSLALPFVWSNVDDFI